MFGFMQFLYIVMILKLGLMNSFFQFFLQVIMLLMMKLMIQVNGIGVHSMKLFKITTMILNMVDMILDVTLMLIG